MKKDLGARLAVYPTPVYLIATYDKADKANVMAVGWGGVCCSTPPSVAISVRKATYTYQALCERQAFTLNLATTAYVEEASYFGLASGRNEDKFATTGLTPIHSDFVDAPYIAELPVNLECQIIHQYEIGSHTQFIGQILNVKVDEQIQTDSPIIEQIHPIVYGVGNDHVYYGLGEKIVSQHQFMPQKKSS